MNAPNNTVRVWDLPTRLFHWLTASLFMFLIATGENGDWLERHMQAGYLLSGLILFRLLWGFVGSYHARFWNFVRSPLVAARYLWQMLKGNTQHYAGHNPAGAIMVVVFLFALLLQALTGLVTSDDIFWEGPLYNSVPESVAELGASIHRSLGELLPFLVLVHVIAVLYHRFRFKDPLIGAMIHGRKPAASEVAIEQYDGISLPKLVVSLLLIAGWLSWLFSRPL